jgi:hypothetical protein
MVWAQRLFGFMISGTNGPLLYSSIIPNEIGSRTVAARQNECGEARRRLVATEASSRVHITLLLSRYCKGFSILCTAQSSCDCMAYCDVGVLAARHHPEPLCSYRRYHCEWMCHEHGIGSPMLWCGHESAPHTLDGTVEAVTIPLVWVYRSCGSISYCPELVS